MDDDQSVNLQQFLTKTNADIGAHGVTFDNSFVNYSLCCPSRSTMLTGQYAHNHGVRGNQLPSGGYSKLAPTLGNTLPVWLQRAGYYTAHIGKFLNGYGATAPDTDVPPGWNEWYGSLDKPDGFTGGTYTAYGYSLNENGRIVHYGTHPRRRRPRHLPDRRLLPEGGRLHQAAGAEPTSPSTSRSPRAIRTRRRPPATAPGTTRARRRATRGTSRA